MIHIKYPDLRTVLDKARKIKKKRWKNTRPESNEFHLFCSLFYKITNFKKIKPSKKEFLVKIKKRKEKKTILDKLSYSFLPQSISFNPSFFKNSFVLENGLLPKKPYLAENGLG